MGHLSVPPGRLPFLHRDIWSITLTRTIPPSLKSVTPLVPPQTTPMSSGEEGAEPPPDPEPIPPAKVRVYFPGEEDPIESSEGHDPEPDGSYFFNLERVFERTPGVDFLTQLVNEPLAVTVIVGETEMARCEVDLFPFTQGVLRCGSTVVDEEANETQRKPQNSEGEELDAHDVGVKFVALTPIPYPVAPPAADGEEEPEALPVNPLLESARIDVSITASFPFVDPNDAEHGLVLTITPTEITHTPPSLSEFEDITQYPFTWAFGVPLPGIEDAVIDGGRLARRPVSDPLTDTDAEQDPELMETYVTWVNEASEESSEEPASSTGKQSGSKKFWLPASTVDALRESLKGRGKTLPVEIARYPSENPRETPDPVFQNYHAVANTTFDELLDPGSMSCAPERAFLKAPIYGHKSCLPVPPEAAEGASGFGDEPAVPPGAVAWAAATQAPEVKFRLTVSKPLLPPWAPPEPTETTVAELLPARDVPVIEEDPPEVVAAREFRQEVTLAATTLAEEYASMFSGAPEDTDEPNGPSTRRKKLVFELNRSGKYHDMKERLKDAASLIVKSRFFQKSSIAPDDETEIDAKYDDLYVHLVEEMHKAISSFGVDDEGEKEKDKDEAEEYERAVKRASLQKQKALADEYEINSLFTDSEKWHQERILLTDKMDTVVWCDYGQFLSRRGRFGAAEEAFKEALVVDSGNVNALRSLTALMLRDEEYSRAEVYGQGVVTEVAPGDAISWSFLASTYQHLEREIDQINCSFKARSLTAIAMTNLMGASPRSRKKSKESDLVELIGPAAHVRAALLCLDLHLYAEACDMLQLGQEDPDSEDSGGLRDDERLTLKLCLARSALIECMFDVEKVGDDSNKEEYERQNQFKRGGTMTTDIAFGHVMDALSIDATDPKPFEVLGDLHTFDERFLEAEEAYTHAMAVSGQRGKPPASLKLFLNLGNTLLRNGKFADARATFIAACEMRPCASTWIGLGVAMMREGDLDGAESALAEANTIDSSNAHAWGWLSIVSILAKRMDEAERAVGSAFKNGLRDHELLSEIAHLFLQNGGWKHAEASARRAVKYGAGIDTRLCLARASRERGDADSSAVELKFALALALDEHSKQSYFSDNETNIMNPLIPELLEELAGVYDELGDQRKADECRRDLRAMEREQ